MKAFVLILILCATWPATSWAQLEPPNQLGVAMSHLHLVVKNVEANKRFFALFGGTPLKVDDTEAMKFPGVLIFLTPGSPAAPGKLGTQVFCGCPDDGL